MWYDNMPTAKTKQSRGDYARWLRQFPWQLYVTLTFAHPVSDAQADLIFRELIDRLGRLYRSPIGFFRGDERRWSGCGQAAVRRHYHALFCCEVRLEEQVVAREWHALGQILDNAWVKRYDPAGCAVEYCVKFNGDAGGDWSMGNLHFFNLAVENSDGNHRARRRHRRQRARASANPPVPFIKNTTTYLNTALPRTA